MAQLMLEEAKNAEPYAIHESAAASEAIAGLAKLFPLADPWAGRTWEMALKRVFDVTVSVLGLVALSPILLLTAILIRLDSRGPAIYRQKRVGLHNREFTIYKFRTMVIDAEKDGPKWADPDDGRVTRVGQVLRKIRIDEVPQLWNVLRGEMSLIGPRPERKCFIRQFVREDPRFAWRTMVKPGITGWAQVNGGYELRPIEKLAFDLEYIRDFSLGLELKIIFRTIGVMLRGDGAR